jgi:hypothetical protein
MPPQLKKNLHQVIQHGLDPNNGSEKIGIFKDDVVLLNCGLLFSGSIKHANPQYTGAAGIAYFKARGVPDASAKRPDEPLKLPFIIFENDLKSDTTLRQAFSRNFPDNTLVCILTVNQYNNLWNAVKNDNPNLKSYSLTELIGFIEHFFFHQWYRG